MQIAEQLNENIIQQWEKTEEKNRKTPPQKTKQNKNTHTKKQKQPTTAKQSKQTKLLVSFASDI